MTGAHDLGGKVGFGPVNPEAEASEPVFHHEWERRVFAITLAVGMLGKWSIDEARFARERQAPETYLGNSYYENWLSGLEKLLQEKELLQENAANSSLRIPDPNDARKILATGGPSLMDSDQPPAYKPGDQVKVKMNLGFGHTRAPSYAQGVIGTVVSHLGCHIFPDQSAQGARTGEHLYSVRFSSQQIWGSKQENFDVLVDLWGSEHGTFDVLVDLWGLKHGTFDVLVDLWEPYLESMSNPNLESMSNPILEPTSNHA